MESRERNRAVLVATEDATGEARGPTLFASGVGVHWYACYTMARREKKMHARLQERGIESFLPVVPRISQWHDRRKRIEWPLLPGYVFARCESAGLQSVLEVPGVAMA